jgi:hypothetical protein
MRIDDISFYLIQRCTINPTDNPQGIDDFLRCDYMGSSEFEFGSLGEPLQEICRHLPDYRFERVGITSLDGKGLWVFAHMKHAYRVVQFLKLEAKEPQRILERSNLKQRLEQPGEPSPDAWWDIGNHWIAGLGGKNQDRLLRALEGSAARLRAKGKIPIEG